MPYIDKTSILIEHSTCKGLTLFDLDDNVIFNNIDNNLNNINSHIILDGKFSFIDIWLDIDNNDNIYGVINNKQGKLQNITINDNNITMDDIIKYDHKNYLIKFPYIKKLQCEKHIIYYSINKNFPNSAYLIHIYESDYICKKNRIDFFNYNILSNFVIIYNNNTPTIFYFKYLDSYEELFMSTFDINSCKWSSPEQITYSQKGKIYLSIIKDDDNIYHIVFSENNDNKYFCNYLSGEIINNKFIEINKSRISKNPMCIFPSIISYNSIFYIQWVEYFDLYTCQSFDNGYSWSTPIINSSVSSFNFQRYEFRSNNNNYNASTIFALKDNTRIIL